MKRPIQTFEAEPDVEAMLARAKEGGIKLRFLCNEALRRYLSEKGYSRKRDPEPKKLSR